MAKPRKHSHFSLSDTFIERAARRVVQLLKEEGLVLAPTEESGSNVDRDTTDPSMWSANELVRARAAERLRSLTNPAKKTSKAL